MKRFLLVALIAITTPVWADPCGLVPPISTQSDPARFLTRTGEQLTYVFFKDGIEDVALRPAFEGKVSEFGMLIPFPSPPAIRKVSDDLFYQIKNAVKPPEVKINLNPPLPKSAARGFSGGSAPSGDKKKLEYETVKVISQEAMGMYQVAVLAAGIWIRVQGSGGNEEGNRGEAGSEESTDAGGSRNLAIPVSGADVLQDTLGTEAVAHAFDREGGDPVGHGLGHLGRGRQDDAVLPGHAALPQP